MQLYTHVYSPILHTLYVYGDLPIFLFFFFNDTATTEIYTLSLHDALPISRFPACFLSIFSNCSRRDRSNERSLACSNTSQPKADFRGCTFARGARDGLDPRIKRPIIQDGWTRIWKDA